MKSKFVVLGIMCGILVGTILTFLLPHLLIFGLKFNTNFNKASNYPSDFYSLSSGSIYNGLPMIALLFGIVGGILGFAIYKITNSKPR